MICLWSIHFFSLLSILLPSLSPQNVLFLSYECLFLPLHQEPRTLTPSLLESSPMFKPYPARRVQKSAAHPYLNLLLLWLLTPFLSFGTWSFHPCFLILFIFLFHKCAWEGFFVEHFQCVCVKWSGALLIICSFYHINQEFSKLKNLSQILTLPTFILQYSVDSNKFLDKSFAIQTLIIWQSKLKFGNMVSLTIWTCARLR